MKYCPLVTPGEACDWEPGTLYPFLSPSTETDLRLRAGCVVRCQKGATFKLVLSTWTLCAVSVEANQDEGRNNFTITNKKINKYTSRHPSFRSRRSHRLSSLGIYSSWLQNQPLWANVCCVRSVYACVSRHLLCLSQLELSVKTNLAECYSRPNANAWSRATVK